MTGLRLATGRMVKRRGQVIGEGWREEVKEEAGKVWRAVDGHGRDGNGEAGVGRTTRWSEAEQPVGEGCGEARTTQTE